MITLDLKPTTHLHCRRCLEDWKRQFKDKSFSPREHSRYEVGISSNAIVVTCITHDLLVTALPLPIKE